MPLISTVGKANKENGSLRTTIPEGIVEFMELQSGDKLKWTMRIDGAKVTVIQKGEKN